MGWLVQRVNQVQMGSTAKMDPTELKEREDCQGKKDNKGSTALRVRKVKPALKVPWDR